MGTQMNNGWPTVERNAYQLTVVWMYYVSVIMQDPLESGFPLIHLCNHTRYHHTWTSTSSVIYDTVLPCIGDTPTSGTIV